TFDSAELSGKPTRAMVDVRHRGVVPCLWVAPTVWLLPRTRFFSGGTGGGLLGWRNDGLEGSAEFPGRTCRISPWRPRKGRGRADHPQRPRLGSRGRQHAGR